ncbi:hypothetical protein [Pedobacter montanisoli]|uniref:Uncharacterized protein n=1 Tax=Pedobacter montanisoli TaxID=2923277 RepID=A0ABS9ZXU9_9SPHI|nr:hypothetical protein [Pedobacter montanisoli]MCJ0743120.1 hypothetical protein [Pedobacter montanisoli]
MAQIPPITDSYIDEIIKSQGAYIEGINKTQGIKLRELIKRLNNYFEQEIPKNTSQLINDSNYVTNPLISGLPEENNSKRPFIIRSLANYNPDEVFGTGTQPLHVMLIATELIAGKETVTQLKISDGVTAFKDLKNLVGSSAGNFVTLDTFQTISEGKIFQGDNWEVETLINKNGATFNGTEDGLYNRISSYGMGIITELSDTSTAGYYNDQLWIHHSTNNTNVALKAEGLEIKKDNESIFCKRDSIVFTGTNEKKTTVKPGVLTDDIEISFPSESGKLALKTDIPTPVDISGKANDADVLHKTGNLNESITGKKTFQQAPALESLTGNRMLSLSATKEIESFYEITQPVISNATIITQLTTAANWNASDVYTGTAITGAYQMQFYADANYWYYFYNDTTPIRIARRATQLAATDTEAQAGTVTNKYLTPANWGYLKGIVNNITALWQFTVGIGIGIAGVTSSFLKLAANTTAKSQVNLTPSATDVTSPVNGDVWNNAGELKLMENSIVNRMVKLYNNELLKSDGNYILMSNQYGDLSNSVKVAERWVYDSDVISAITGASWSSNRANITPANNKVMYKGQRYDDGTYTYEATEDNYLRRW